MQAAAAIGRQIMILDVGSDRDIETAFATLVQRGAGRSGRYRPFHVLPTRTTVALAARHAVPAIYARESVLAGGLMSYGASITGRLSPSRHLCRSHPQGREAGRPAGLRATKFELVINLKTAKALGLDVPPTLLATADEVIE